MSYIPNCREDEVYNEKFLNESGKKFIAGYDSALELGLIDLFDNLDEDDFDFDGIDFNIVRLIENHPEIQEALTKAMIREHEAWRNELIVSMLEKENEQAGEAKE